MKKNGFLMGAAFIMIAALVLTSCEGSGGTGVAIKDSFAGKTWSGVWYYDDATLSFTSTKDSKTIALSIDGESTSGAYSILPAYSVTVNDDTSLALLDGEKLIVAGNEFSRVSGKTGIEGSKWEYESAWGKQTISFTKGAATVSQGDESMKGTYKEIPVVRMDVKDWGKEDLILVGNQLVNYIDIDYADIILAEGSAKATSSTTSSTSSSTPTSSSTSSSAKKTDWDKLLDDYEEYMNESVEITKKMMSGDMTVVTRLTTLTEQVQELADQLEDASSELSTAQMTRLSQIAEKAANALTE
jgi:hypothetical protein